MLIAHPCSMRRGAHVRDYVQMTRVEEGPPIASSGWDGNYGVLPLPELFAPADLRHRATFELAGRVQTSALQVNSRIACLSTQGITLLLQRLAFNYTRVVVELDVIHEAIAHVLEEADLLEEWLSLRCQVPPEQLLAAIHRQEEEEFDAVMSGHVGGVSLRQRLLDPKERAGVRRMVRDALGRS